MDPNANLEELLRLAAHLLFQAENENEISVGDTMRAAELVLALDGWISKGGALPKAWERKP